MISVPTTFVVGAGASSDYGLPLASELRKNAVNLMSNEMYDLIREVNSSSDGAIVQSFIYHLSNHPTDSIDDFLLTRQGNPSLMNVGRTVVAALMAQAIHNHSRRRKQATPSADRDWLGVIFDRMRRGAADFDAFINGNKVSFVTFNFDSVIEERLTDLVTRYCAGGCDQSRLLAAIPVIHVHGRLPEPEPRLLRPEGDVDLARDRGWFVWLQNATEQVRIIHDQIDDADLEAARQALRSAKVIVFLGMAYHQENLLRLDVPSTLKPQKLVYGTSHGMPPVDTEFVKTFMHNKITFSDSRCKQALEQLQWWRGQPPQRSDTKPQTL